jgi:hypothetical protein
MQDEPEGERMLRIDHQNAGCEGYNVVAETKLKALWYSMNRIE